MRERRIVALSGCLMLMALGWLPALVHAQGNYEIQVYGADTVPPHTLMVELHSNFTVQGEQNTIDGVYPTNHQEHETLELTQGINEWSEVGFYVFTSEQDGHGVQWVGDHIRPRIRVPDSWDWPAGVKISYDFTRVVSAGLEYYADYGPLDDFVSTHNQQQQLFAVTDLNVSPLWEINIGVGIGLTGTTDHFIVKCILGRRFDWGRHSPVD